MEVDTEVASVRGCVGARSAESPVFEVEFTYDADTDDDEELGGLFHAMEMSTSTLDFASIAGDATKLQVSAWRAASCTAELMFSTLLATT